MIGTVRINDFEMDYCRFGEGEKSFVIIPGLSPVPVTPSEEAIKGTFSAFLADFTVYLFDRKKQAPEGYSIEEMAEDTFAAMTELGIGEAYVYGASQGGMIGQQLAINHPETVKKLVLASTVGRANDTLCSKIDSWIQLAKKGLAYELNEKLYRDIYSEATLEKYLDAILPLGNNITKENLQQFIRVAPAILDFDAFDRLSEIRCDTLVVGAEGDTVMTPEGIRELIEKLDCEYYMYGDEYAHAVYDEAPDFTKRVLDFLRG